MNDKYEAIAWLANIKEKYIHGGDEEFDECRRESIDMAIKALRQPQIVRCKDCIHFGQKDKCIVQKYLSEHPEKVWFLSLQNNWFCADGKRENEQ